MNRFWKFLPLLALTTATPARADIAWTNSLGTARSQAAASGRPIFVDFYTDWCGWCKKLDADVYSNPDVQRAAQNFVMVKLDAEGGGAADAKAFQVSGFPTLMFLGPSGQMLGKQAGYVDAGTLTNAMTQVLAQVRPTKKAPTTAAPALEPSGKMPAAQARQIPTQLRAPSPTQRDWRKLPGMEAAIGQANGQVYLLDENGVIPMKVVPKKPAPAAKTLKVVKKPVKKSR